MVMPQAWTREYAIRLSAARLPLSTSSAARSTGYALGRIVCVGNPLRSVCVRHPANPLGMADFRLVMVMISCKMNEASCFVAFPIGFTEEPKNELLMRNIEEKAPRFILSAQQGHF